MQAEVPGALAVPAHPTNYRAASRTTYARVIIHITDGHADPHAVADMWQEPTHGSSAHFVVGQDGTVIQCVLLRDVAWHAHAASGNSVGIEHCARTPGELGPDDPGLPPSPALYEASAHLVAYLLRAAGLPCDREHVVGHAEADVATTHDDCPTGAWSWDTYWPYLVAAYAELAA